MQILMEARQKWIKHFTVIAFKEKGLKTDKL